jgi:Zn finger protein HypA/HybF involved in hydrogenase expression
MRQELEEKLAKAYPEIFEECWEIGCGDGWYWLIEQLCHSIQMHVHSQRKPHIKALQVKEKFGRLRFNTNRVDNTIDGMIWLAESMSKGICEMCGTVENVTATKDGWIKYLCPKCMNERRKVIERTRNRNISE